MFILDGKPLSIDVAFTTPDGTQYPANWLRLSTLEEKEAVGITEVPDISEEPYDSRFYVGWDHDGNLIAKDHAELVVYWSSEARNIANTMLTPTDWMVIREMDNGTPVDATVKTWREAVRLSSGSKVFEINATTTVQELASYITGPDYQAWPQLDLTNEG